MGGGNFLFDPTTRQWGGVSLCMIFLIIFTVLFEYVIHTIQRISSHQKSSALMFDHLYKELMILGFVSFGILLYISDRFNVQKKLDYDFDLKSSIIIGMFHAISLIPGVSRSGLAITFSRFLGFNRVDSAKISFLLSIPTLLAVSFYGIYSLYETNDLLVKQLNFMFVLMSFLFSYTTIVFFLKFLKKSSLIVFVIYRIILGFVLLYLAYL